jgi:hypothetical protein
VSSAVEFFILHSPSRMRLRASNGVSFVWDKHFVPFSMLRVKAKADSARQYFHRSNQESDYGP